MSLRSLESLTRNKDINSLEILLFFNLDFEGNVKIASRHFSFSKILCKKEEKSTKLMICISSILWS